jgi:hypothetical protein
VSLDPDPTDEVDYSPTSVDVLQNRYALVTADTSASKTDPSRRLVVVDIDRRTVVTELDLGGQPDSAKISPDHRYLAIAIENERDEEVEVGGVKAGCRSHRRVISPSFDCRERRPTGSGRTSR